MTSGVVRRSAIVRGLKRLGRPRLLELARENLDEPPNGLRWSRLNAGALAEIVADTHPNVQELAADGIAKQRSPSVGGPFWRYSGTGPNDAMNAARVASALPPLRAAIADIWDDVSATLIRPELLSGIVQIEYTAYEPRAVGARIVEARTTNPALIFLDFDDGTSTVSARSDEEALLIGSSWARAVGCDQVPVELDFEPSFDFPPLSAQAVRLIEAVYGRVGSIGPIVNVDHISTQRQDPDSDVQRQSARGEAGHALLDDDVRRCLQRGDFITGLSFQLEWKWDQAGAHQPYIAHVTLSSEQGPLFLRVTRAGQSMERCAALYQLVRRALSLPTSDAGAARVESQIQAILRQIE
jgi:hypothetical protein